MDKNIKWITLDGRTITCWKTISKRRQQEYIESYTIRIPKTSWTQLFKEDEEDKYLLSLSELKHAKLMAMSYWSDENSNNKDLVIQAICSTIQIGDYGLARKLLTKFNISIDWYYKLAKVGERDPRWLAERMVKVD